LNIGIKFMMITAAELEEIIVRTPAGERIVYDGRQIGSTDAIAEKLAQLKLSRSGDPTTSFSLGSTSQVNAC
jgi:hypothetical protein